VAAFGDVDAEGGGARPPNRREASDAMMATTTTTTVTTMVTTKGDACIGGTAVLWFAACCVLSWSSRRLSVPANGAHDTTRGEEKSPQSGKMWRQTHAHNMYVQWSVKEMQLLGKNLEKRRHAADDTPQSFLVATSEAMESFVVKDRQTTHVDRNLTLLTQPHKLARR
jgi:hypothetical protein